MAECFLGALDWEHAAWRGTFYPDDLPEDWTLAFYNQHWRCVVIPAARWKVATHEQVAQWANETLERFRFLVETEGTGADEKGKLAALGTRLAMHYAPSRPPAEVIWIEHPVDVRAWAKRLSNPGTAQCLYLISREARLDDMETLDGLMRTLGY